MCNLLVPLCPFVLHSVTYPKSRDVPPNSSTDAKVFYSYMSKRPYQTLRKDSCHASQPPPKPLSLPSNKLYKRTTWHTCPCLFARVSVMHSLPGPSRPTFGSAYQHCRRCSSAAKVLRLFRRGGPNDLSTRNDPFWNRCSFLSASGVFDARGIDDDDDEGSDDDYEENRNARRPQIVAVRSAEPVREARYPLDLREEHQWNDQHRGGERWSRDHERCNVRERTSGRVRDHGNGPGRDLPTTHNRYQADLDAYLKETYGERKTRNW